MTITVAPQAAVAESRSRRGLPSGGDEPVVPPGSEAMARPWRLALIGLGIAVGLVSRLFVANGVGSLDTDSFVLTAAASSGLAALGIIAQAAERDRFGSSLMLLTITAALSLGVAQWISPNFAPATLEWSTRTQLALTALGIGNGLLLAGIMGLALTRRMPTLTVACTLLAGVMTIAVNSALLRNEWPAILCLAGAFGALLIAWDRAPRYEPTYTPGDEAPRISRAALGLVTLAFSGAAIQLWISRGEDVGAATPAVGVAAVLIGLAFLALLRVRRDIQNRETSLSEWTSWMREIRTRTLRNDFESLSVGRDGMTVGDVTSAPGRALSFPDLAPLEGSGDELTTMYESAGSGADRGTQRRRGRRSSEPKPSFEWIDLDDVVVQPDPAPTGAADHDVNPAADHGLTGGVDEDPSQPPVPLPVEVQIPGFDDPRPGARQPWATAAPTADWGLPGADGTLVGAGTDGLDTPDPGAGSFAASESPAVSAQWVPEAATSADDAAGATIEPITDPTQAVSFDEPASWPEAALQPSLFGDLPPTAFELSWADEPTEISREPAPPQHVVAQSQAALFDLDDISWIDEPMGSPASAADATSGPGAQRVNPATAKTWDAEDATVVEADPSGAFSNWLETTDEPAPAVSPAWAGAVRGDAVVEWLEVTDGEPSRLVVAIETMSLADFDELPVSVSSAMIDATAMAIDRLTPRPRFVAHIDGPYLFAVWDHQDRAGQLEINRAALATFATPVPTTEGLVALSGTIAFVLPGLGATFDSVVTDAIDGLVAARRAMLGSGSVR